jgi:hypothetical protein
LLFLILVSSEVCLMSKEDLIFLLLRIHNYMP